LRTCALPFVPIGIFFFSLRNGYSSGTLVFSVEDWP
jgi:hypothetical protein